jgi:nitric oxide reductase subunit C
MLTKSQARAFFIGGTAFFSIIFIALTIDTLQKIPELSNEKNLTPSVIRGKQIWDDNNCMGCHTLLGEGAYYAPELTKVLDRRGEPWIRLFLKNPEAMFPGQRKMVQYNFTDDQITDVIAFLKWIGEINTQGFPPKPIIAMSSAPIPASTQPAAKPPSALSVTLTDGTTNTAPPDIGREEPATAKSDPPCPPMFTNICMACHVLNGKGAAVGPALDGVGDRFTPELLDVWLKDPQAVKPGTLMPNLGLDEATRRSLVEFLSAQRAGK